ncbi:hypothetical protein DIURU_001213 [Diutina rugosa]|uniref:Chloride channel protein n=1 Tax=Diutina rugosa TaxID=5481 RepID=A0A642UV07_DIURU|nr:uncharacterized protein DIURU_001213 [Diutina rugosa]KAA8906031.1 hypothetical protein DIURU_001213 [Diutina rugosa]
MNLRSRSTGSWVNQKEVAQVQRFDQFRTIDWVEDELDEQRQRLSKVKNLSGTTSFKSKVYASMQNWLVLTVMGIIIGAIASCLNIITSWAASIRTGHCPNNFYLSRTLCCWWQSEHCPDWHSWTSFSFLNYLVYLTVSILLAYIAAILVKIYAPSAAGSGISEIKCIVSGFVMDGFLGWKTLVIKSVGLPLAIASGLSVGKEGPSVHYAVCVGNVVAQYFPQYLKSAAKGREFLTATAAAGVAVAFGSPMGGVLFSIEEISSVFQLATIWKSYFCALIAVTTLAIINPFRTGQLVLFEVSYHTNWRFFEIPVYVLIGAFGGVYGILISKLNIRVVAFRKKYLGNYAVQEVVLLALFTASIAYFNEFLRLDMTEAMQLLFKECDDRKFSHDLCDPNSKKVKLFFGLLFATIARCFLTIITYGCKVPAGIFVPSMAAGATFGRALGILVDAVYQNNRDSSLFSRCPAEGHCIIPGTYAFLGAAAALSGITHLTVTVVVIMFELTGAIRYIIPTMIVVTITKLINDKWGHGGIADQMIRFNGLPCIDPKEDFGFGSTTVDAAMTPVIVTFSASRDQALTLGQLRATLASTNFRGYPIIHSAENCRLVGFVSRSDLEIMLEKDYSTAADDVECNFDPNTERAELADFKTLINKSPLAVALGTSLEYVSDIFVRLGPRYVLIVKDGALVGLLTRKDILRYEYTLHQSTTQDPRSSANNDAIDARIWDSMQRVSTNVRRLVGRVLHRDENRYVAI